MQIMNYERKKLQKENQNKKIRNYNHCNLKFIGINKLMILKNLMQNQQNQIKVMMNNLNKELMHYKKKFKSIFH